MFANAGFDYRRKVGAEAAEDIHSYAKA